jgi:hypothetical protein
MTAVPDEHWRAEEPPGEEGNMRKYRGLILNHL